MVYLHNVTEKNKIPEEPKQNTEKEIDSVLDYGERVLI
jgi:hypothetical protein